MPLTYSELRVARKDRYVHRFNASFAILKDRFPNNVLVVALLFLFSRTNFKPNFVHTLPQQVFQFIHLFVGFYLNKFDAIFSFKISYNQTALDILTKLGFPDHLLDDILFQLNRNTRRDAIDLDSFQLDDRPFPFPTLFCHFISRQNKLITPQKVLKLIARL